MTDMGVFRRLVFDLTGLPARERTGMLNITTRYFVIWTNTSHELRWINLYDPPELKNSPNIYYLGLNDWYQFLIMQPTVTPRNLIKYFTDK